MLRTLGILGLLLVSGPFITAHTLPSPSTARMPRPSLYVRVALDEGLGSQNTVVASALELAHEIWRPYADVVLGFDGDSRAHASLVALTVRVTEHATASGNSSDNNGLGWIEFVGNRPADTLTVSLAAARRLALVTSWQGRALSSYPPYTVERFLSNALGRAIAHEVGHFLLGSKRHTATGLMRAQFTGPELMRMDHDLDQLEADDLARIRGRFVEMAESGDSWRSMPAPPS